MWEYLIIAISTWALKTLVDIGVKHSKTTENTIDDLIFNSLKVFINKLNLTKWRKT